jgi:hypothetical protein
VNRIKNERIKSGRIKSDRIKSVRIKSDRIKTDRIKRITDPRKHSHEDPRGEAPYDHMRGVYASATGALFSQFKSFLMMRGHEFSAKWRNEAMGADIAAVKDDKAENLPLKRLP